MGARSRSRVRRPSMLRARTASRFNTDRGNINYGVSQNYGAANEEAANVRLRTLLEQQKAMSGAETVSPYVSMNQNRTTTTPSPNTAEQQVAAAQEQIATQGAEPEPFEGLLNETAPTPTPAPTPTYSGPSFGPYATQPQNTRLPQALPGINRMVGGQNLPQALPGLNRGMADGFGTGGTGAYDTRFVPGTYEERIARAEANAQAAPQRRTVSRRRIGNKNYNLRSRSRFRSPSRRRVTPSRLRRF